MAERSFSVSGPVVWNSLPTLHKLKKKRSAKYLNAGRSRILRSAKETNPDKTKSAESRFISTLQPPRTYPTVLPPVEIPSYFNVLSSRNDFSFSIFSDQPEEDKEFAKQEEKRLKRKLSKNQKQEKPNKKRNIANYEDDDDNSTSTDDISDKSDEEVGCQQIPSESNCRKLFLITLGVSDPTAVQVTPPGAYHRARCMTKGIYCLKIFCFRELLK
ncbi:hypothetical protein HELRODRAFT_158451 [Helobdella robusta]|uniref:Uncharacterized protein n=1 Tax=Helobdella robusta TaxID=6412 RepID=T1EMT1_HELRO|nr:hypothetical protein HELRODRAFT_158451 [Helobdella robusta]ESO12044.1 hypothetical protein HELRODRAFT_158451 [Helobdella robusta]